MTFRELIEETFKKKKKKKRKLGKVWRKEGKKGFVRRIYEIDPDDITEKDKERFWKLVHKEGNGKSDHHIFTGWYAKYPDKKDGTPSAKKYGMFSIKQKNHEKSIDVRAIRFCWTMYYNRKIPKGKVIGHLCSDSRCVRKSHIYLASPEDNVIDRFYPEKQPSIKELMKKNYEVEDE